MGPGRAHHRTNDFPGVFWAFNDKCHDWATRHESNELGVETFALVLLVMALKNGGVECSKLESNELQALCFKTRKDSSDKLTFYCIGL